MRFARLVFGLLLFAGLFASRPAVAQQIKGRVMVLLDTSGSMGFYFRDPRQFGVPPNGDYPGGDGSFSLTDNGGNNNAFLFPGKNNGGQCTLQTLSTRCDGVNSRLWGAKDALQDAVNAYSGNVDFGLMTFDFNLCPFNRAGCETCAISCNIFGCSYSCLYTNNAFTQLASINWAGSSCNGTGGKIIALPGTDARTQILPWIDGVEIHQDAGNGQPRNPEIRGHGGTPLASSIRYARTNWYDPIKNAAPGGQNYDAQLACRPYSLVVETDGADSCGGDPVAEARSLFQSNAQNPVSVYVIGLAIGQGSQAVLNNTAAAGGTGQARFANTPTEIKAAYADILAKSIKVEYCNNKDDNCNVTVDEGYDKGAACTVGVGACRRTGIKKCDAMVNTQTTCCTNDNNPNGPCAALMPGAPGVEICNGIDDNCDGQIDEGGVCQMPQCFPETCNGKDDDCDKIVDNNLVDVGRACGLNLGVCRPGTTACVNGGLVCQGGTQPGMETCNNLDDDCDGVVDGMSRTCYSGPQGTDGVGICRGGLQKCGAGMWGMCVGEVTPAGEICNGIDDNCNGKVDDVMGAGVPCCPSGLCGVGICTAGMTACSGGGIACAGGQGPQGEVCNGKDDDCNGKIDDLPSLGKPCTPQNGCSGILVCDVMQGQVVCSSQGMGAKELCNNRDDNCNGLVDEEPDVSMNDPLIGQPCGNEGMLPLPCLSGKTVCKAGKPFCQGAVGPQVEACNCKDDNCNNVVDDNAFCPQGTACVSCGCYIPCRGGEFPCDGGYTCIDVNTKLDCTDARPNNKCYCVPDQTCSPACSACETCKAQPPPAKSGVCVDKCAELNCPNGYECKCGQCVDKTCVGNPALCKKCDGASGERCDPIKRACVPDLCCGKNCGGGVCQPLTGECTESCKDVKCPPGERCLNGKCGPDKCAGVMCPQLQTCDPNTGVCQMNPCLRSSCIAGQACCVMAGQGICVQDPCSLVTCEPGFKCSVNSLSCAVSCDKPVVNPVDQERVVGAGGGGAVFTCAIGTRAGGTSASGSLGLLGLAALLLRRRRARG